jgi:hypothetical protein
LKLEAGRWKLETRLHPGWNLHPFIRFHPLPRAVSILNPV